MFSLPIKPINGKSHYNGYFWLSSLIAHYWPQESVVNEYGGKNEPLKILSISIRWLPFALMVKGYNGGN